MFILQENLNYSPVLYVVFQIFPQLQRQVLPNLTRGVDPSFDMCVGGRVGGPGGMSMPMFTQGGV